MNNYVGRDNGDKKTAGWAPLSVTGTLSLGRDRAVFAGLHLREHDDVVVRRRLLGHVGELGELRAGCREALVPLCEAIWSPFLISRMGTHPLISVELMK